MRKRKRYGKTARFDSKSVLKRGIVLAAFMLVCAVLLFYGLYAYEKTGTVIPTEELFDGRPTIRFVDVWQGDCTLITYKGDAVLIDAGNASNGEKTADYIRLYAPEIDYMIITHPHEDHMGGAAEVLSRVTVDNLVLRDISVGESFYSKAIKQAEKSGTEIIRISEPTEYTVGDIHIEILDVFDLDYDDLNDSSMVTRVTVGSTTVLVTGDAERDEEALLLWRDADNLDCDILKVGHHGSNTSTSEKFLEAVSPEKCVISCGRRNSYGHPSPEVLKRIRDYGAEIYRTDKGGTVVLRGEK